MLTDKPRYIRVQTSRFRYEIGRSLNLLKALVLRDFRGRYRRSILGPLWAIIRPVYLMVIFSILSGLVNIPSEGIPYPIFSYSVLVPWTFFTTVINSCSISITSNRSILKKVNVVRETFLMVAVAMAFIDLLISGLVLAGMMLWYQIPVNWTILWIFPLLLLTTLLALGVGMFIAALGVYKTDFITAGSLLLQLWLYATPIIYPLSSVPENWRQLYLLNPMVGILQGFREVLALGKPPDLELLLWGLPGIVLVLLVSWPLFRLTSQYFADVL